MSDSTMKKLPELPPGYEIDFHLCCWDVYERGEQLDFEFSVACGNENEQPYTREAAIELCWRLFNATLDSEWLEFFEQARSR